MLLAASAAARNGLDEEKHSDMTWSAIPYCGPGAVPQSLWHSWNLDPWLLLGLAGFAAAGVGMRGHRCAGWRASPWGRADSAFAGGWLTLVIAFVSPLCALSAALFSARIVHHMLLVVVAAPLLALAWREAMAERTRRPLPLVPLAVLHVVLFWVWHAPGPYAAAMAQHGVYWMMELSLLGSAVLFWLAALDRRASMVGVAPTIIAVMAQMGLLGALLVFAGRPLHAPHYLTTWAWGLTPLQDQALAGLLMWAPGALPYLIVLLAVVVDQISDAPRSLAAGAASSDRSN